MDIASKIQLPASLPDNSRLWVYQANRQLSENECAMLRKAIHDFVSQWQSHGQQVKAFGDVFHRRFVVLAADDSHNHIGGCSIDSSVAFVKQLGQQLDVDFFDRMLFTWLENGEMRAAHRDDFALLFQEGKISEDTLVFDTLVQTKKDFETQWLKPLKDSWHARMV